MFGSYVGDEDRSGDYWEIELYVGDDVGSRDSSNISKCIKLGVNVIIDDSVSFGVNRGVGDEVFRSVDGQVKI